MAPSARTVGIIGLGFGRAHIPAFQSHGCEVVAVCQRDQTAARAVADRYGVPHVFERWQEMLSSAKPEMVVIATPPVLHKAIALEAFAAGAHVLCEKPLAMNAAECRAMIDAAAQAKRVGMTGFNWRYTAAMQRFHALVEAGALGRLFHANLRWMGSRWADESAPATWRMDRAQAGHGAMGDMGVHVIDIVRWHFGEIAAVSAQTGIAYPSKTVPRSRQAPLVAWRAAPGGKGRRLRPRQGTDGFAEVRGGGGRDGGRGQDDHRAAREALPCRGPKGPERASLLRGRPARPGRAGCRAGVHCVGRPDGVYLGHTLTIPGGLPMEFEYSKKTKMYMEQVTDFMGKHIYPAEPVFHEQLNQGPTRWQVPPVMEELKAKARERGLWNLFLPESERGAGLTNLEYAPLCEIMGRSPIAPEAFNCSAPDTGNMETIERYGSPEQKKEWLQPLLEGKIRSAFAMTEPKVASSDATNIESSIIRDGDSYVINGHKWWTSGIGDPRCKVLIFMGKTEAKNPDKYKQQSMILVPRDAPGITVLRMLTVFGYDDAPHGHGEVTFENVRVPASNMLLGEGRGFEIAQGRLGPGRIHHCMRQIGVAERALELMCRRSTKRIAFGKPLADNDITLERIAQSRIEIDQARLLVLHAAYMMDTVGNKAARQAIAEIKVAVPNMTLAVVERAMQLHGGGGVSQEFPLASMWAHSRTLRFADGPDEVHRRQIGRLELRKHA